VSDDSFETIITNLDQKAFNADEIKDLYNKRWGIETSFRRLKYTLGLLSFHAKKVDYIKQEIFARLTLYNYCELITSHVVEQMEDKDNTKQVNFTIAIYICREFLRHKKQLSPPDVIKLIKKYILPVRLGRKDPRKVKPQSVVSFLYRVA
jgi:predicted glutamine amidotransferase